MYRSLTEHWLATQPTKLGWWLLLILKASHKDIQVSTGSQIIELKRGQIAASLSYLATLWKTSKTSAERFLDMLVKNGMVERHTERKITIITICNYGLYQGEEGKGRYDVSDNMRNDSGTMAGTKQECKECKEDIIINNNLNARTREERVSWDEAVEQGYCNRFKAQGCGMKVARATGLKAVDIMTLLDMYTAKCELRNAGHKDFNHFNTRFLWAIQNKWVTLPVRELQAQSKKVTSNEDTYRLMQEIGWQSN